MNHLRARAEHLLRTEGVHGLLAGLGRHVRVVRRSVFCVDRYVIYRFDTDASGLAEQPPDIDGLEVVVLERDEDVERLIGEGFDIPPFHPSFRREWLKRGGVAACAFVHRQPAHIGWVALSADAKGCCDGLPYRVDFEHGEACWGGAYTWPPFRGRGLYAYVCGVRLKYMREHGFASCRDAVEVRNVSSLKGQAPWHPGPCLSGRLVRFLKWTSWREQPYEGALP